MNRRPVKLLLVEDDQEDYVIVLDHICRMREPCVLDWVCSFDDALEAVARREHDVCVLDYWLGSDSGLDLLREIRANGYTIPVIMLTRHNQKDLETECLKAGAVAFLLKNQLAPERLEEAIQEALGRPPVSGRHSRFNSTDARL